MKTRFVLIALCVLSVVTAGFSDARDFGFRPLRNKIRYKEDYFRLYNQWLYSDLDSVSRNIFFLEAAYAMPYDHPIKALTPITNETQYEKYKNMLMAKICALLTQEYITYGYFYMKEHIYFFNREFFRDYLDGYEIAEKYFRDAKGYWDQARTYARTAADFRGWRTGLISFEDDIHRINSGVLDYDKVITNLFARIERNRRDISLHGTDFVTN